MSDLNIEIGNRIKYLREKSNMTQAELAEYLDISNKHCSEVERGLSSLSLERLIEVCDLYDVSLDYLIRGIPSGGLGKIPPSVILEFENADEQESELLHVYLQLFQRIKNLKSLH